jgi:hypothetical protein
MAMEERVEMNEGDFDVAVVEEEATGTAGATEGRGEDRAMVMGPYCTPTVDLGSASSGSGDRPWRLGAVFSCSVL